MSNRTTRTRLLGLAVIPVLALGLSACNKETATDVKDAASNAGAAASDAATNASSMASSAVSAASTNVSQAASDASTNVSSAASAASTNVSSAASDASTGATNMTKVDANTASVEDIQKALEDAGVPNAAKWAKEVEEYRPYEASDNFARLRQELSKYTSDTATIDKIVSVLKV